MSDTATYEQAHLVAAGVRVLEHKNQHPPTEEELAELLGISREWIGALVRAMADKGILRLVETAFTLRVELGDHRKLEELPREHEAKAITEELAEFSEKRKKEEEALEKMFGGEFKKKQQEEMDKLADEFKNYKPKGPKKNSLFD